MNIADIKLLVDQDNDDKIQGISRVPQKEINLYPKPKPSVPVCQVDKVVLDPDNILSAPKLYLY